MSSSTASPTITPAPSRKHQEIFMKLSVIIAGHVHGRRRSVFAAPFDVRLTDGSERDEDIFTVVQPDIVVMCDPRKLDERGCIGAMRPRHRDRIAGHRVQGHKGEAFALRAARGKGIPDRLSGRGRFFAPGTGLYRRERRRIRQARGLRPRDTLKSTTLRGLSVSLDKIFGY